MPTIIVDGESYEGGPEDDTVLIWANDVVADGGGGDDWLSTRLFYEAAAGISLSTRQIGGTGNDYLKAAMSLEGPPEDDDIPLSMSGTFDAGDGDDGIWAEFTSAYADQFVTVDAGDGDDRVTVSQPRFEQWSFDNENHRSESAVRAGDGDDVVSVFLWEGDFESLADAGTGAMSTVHGSDGADRITSEAHSSSGGGAENFLYGGDGKDEIKASASTGTYEGLAGPAYNRARGGEGDDRIEMEATTSALGTLTNSATGDAGNDTISVYGMSWSASAQSDISGGEGDDRLTARIYVDNEFVGDYVYSAVNRVDGGAGEDRITGIISTAFDQETGDFFSELHGREGDDLIIARGGFDNILAGNQGDDTLRGSGYSDRLIGGQGADVLSGGEGEDEFVFMSPRGAASERDRILYFARGEDRIDISAIDANAFRGGDQAFRFDGSSGTGRAWVEEDPESNGGLLYADTGRGILVVAIHEAGNMDASDYEARDFLL
ncbi:calcium-binding protein [Amaricoccus sp. W119]|uniref:calcium-binding protein n=1 Tax=Amaricoccus sp. W119 TaxID=3391833 RepID=UPI0039A47EAD